MHDRQTINLPTKLSELNLGIWLHWQEYDGEQLLQSGHQYSFVPKSHINANGSGTYFPMFTGVGTAVGSGGKDIKKYLYIKDDTITGHPSNSLAGDAGGVGTNRFVLSGVIGF